MNKNETVEIKGADVELETRKLKQKEKWEALNLQILCAALSNPKICEWLSLRKEWQEKMDSGEIKITTGIERLFDLVTDIAEEWDERFGVEWEELCSKNFANVFPTKHK